MKTSLFIPLRSAASVMCVCASFHILAKVNHVPQTMTRRICPMTRPRCVLLHCNYREVKHETKLIMSCFRKRWYALAVNSPSSRTSVIQQFEARRRGADTAVRLRLLRSFEPRVGVCASSNQIRDSNILQIWLIGSRKAPKKTTESAETCLLFCSSSPHSTKSGLLHSNTALCSPASMSIALIIHTCIAQWPAALKGSLQIWLHVDVTCRNLQLFRGVKHRLHLFCCHRWNLPVAPAASLQNPSMKWQTDIAWRVEHEDDTVINTAWPIACSPHVPTVCCHEEKQGQNSLNCHLLGRKTGRRPMKCIIINWMHYCPELIAREEHWNVFGLFWWAFRFWSLLDVFFFFALSRDVSAMGVKMLQCFPFYRRCKERCKSRQCPPPAGEMQAVTLTLGTWTVMRRRFLMPWLLVCVPQFPSRRQSLVCAPPRPGAATAKEQEAWVGTPRSISPPKPGCLSGTSWTATSTQWTPPTERHQTQGLQSLKDLLVPVNVSRTETQTPGSLIPD